MAGAAGHTVLVGNEAQYWEWDLTTLVQSHVAIGQYTLNLQLQNDVTTSDPANFNSREAADNKPQLIVKP